jgi:hypothetical protein
MNYFSLLKFIISARSGRRYSSHVPSLVMLPDMFHFWLKSAIVAIFKTNCANFCAHLELVDYMFITAEMYLYV